MTPRSSVNLIPLGLLLGALPAAAAEAQDLPEVVVTATSVKEAVVDVPASVQVITQEEIRNSPARDAGDLIAGAGLGHVTNYGGALTGSIEIRGLQSDYSSALSSRVLILINGSRAGTVNLAKIPTQDIERIEIVKGPASVIYGSSAMGGVVNIITKAGAGEGFRGSLGVEGGSFAYWKILGDVRGRTGKFDYFASASREGRGSYKAPDVGQIGNSGYKAETVSTRLGYAIAEGQRLAFGYQRWKGWDIGSQGATYAPDPDDYNRKKRDAFDLDYQAGSFNAKYYYVADRDEWYSNSSYMAGWGADAVDKTSTDTQGASLQKTFELGDHRIVTGGQWDRIKVGSHRNMGAPYNPDSRYDSYGAFAEWRLGLLDKRLLVSAGLRFDHFENKILDTPGMTGMVARTASMGHTTVRGGVVYKLTGAFSLKANAGTAFRAPSPLELAADYSSFGTHYVGNRDLDPEKSTTVDAGFECSSHGFKGGFSYYHTDFKDKIVSYYSTGLSAMTYRNAGQARIDGWEFDGSYDLASAMGLKLVLEPFVHANYHTRFEQTAAGVTTPLTFTPKWSASTGLKLGQDAWDALLTFAYHGHEWVTDWNSNNATYGQTINKGGFTLLNLKGAYRPVKMLECSLSVENALDRHYQYNLGYPMPERNYVGSVKWLF
jgi:vitamin B12 transporter